MLERILIADDSEPVKKAVKIALKGKKVQVMEADSYAEALNICKEFKPQYIIADAGLTGTSTPKEFEKLKADAGGANVLLLQGSFEHVDMDHFVEAGFGDFLKKPFNSNELHKVLEQHLGSGEEGGLEDAQGSAFDSMAPESQVNHQVEHESAFLSVDSNIEMSGVSALEEDQEHSDEFSPLTINPESAYEGLSEGYSQFQEVGAKEVEEVQHHSEIKFDKDLNHDEGERYPLSQPPEELNDIPAPGEETDEEGAFASGMSAEHSEIYPVSGQQSLFDRIENDENDSDDDYSLSQGPIKSDEFPSVSSSKDPGPKHTNHVKMPPPASVRKTPERADDVPPVSNVSNFSDSTKRFRHWFLPLYDREILPFLKKEIQREVKLELERQLPSGSNGLVKSEISELVRQAIREEIQSLLSKI